MAEHRTRENWESLRASWPHDSKVRNVRDLNYLLDDYLASHASLEARVTELETALDTLSVMAMQSERYGSHRDPDFRDAVDVGLGLTRLKDRPHRFAALKDIPDA